MRPPYSCILATPFDLARTTQIADLIGRSKCRLGRGQPIPFSNANRDSTLKARRNRSHRPLPDFEYHLLRRRQEIACCFALDTTDEAAARELDAALEDLAYWLRRSWLFLRNADRNASVAAQRKFLTMLVAEPIEDRAILEEFDPAVLIRIGSHLSADGRQSGHFRLLTGAASVDEVRLAVSSALSGLGRVRRGRPPNTESLALRQLAYGLAATWVNVTGSAPTRRVTWDDHREYGPYRTFVASVLDAVPRQLRTTRKGAVRGIDFIARLGIESYRAAQTTVSPAQPFGPLEETRW